ncbi:TonB-linked SusC/RagA family outer membrane protein [Gelidibacter algens]|uniref:TonB-linked SusC/RagA family outer membrane protein n=1 Tax=Gelidibacter algens TaxID=49280 RepID=A0A1A7R3L6_9FLAO|nr:SusC/RagA family TonB-linked outer membrane protein [Gelidibacter algens]OBX25367.1 SusC/RagA family TonB-linked outer membrane protein [Gelidibacter algens]RAJ25160.1 TonB-linked SusC/RagA family outer membrane protein [Gelidibacter algens]
MKKEILMKGKLHIKLLTFALFAISTIVYGQTNPYVFKGNVTDNATEQPIAGASVFIENTNVGSVTDFDGNYSFAASLKAGDYTIVVSYLGFSTKKVKVTTSGDVIETNVSLNEDLLSLDEVVITGNTVGVNKRTLGNAISTVSAEDLVNNGATSVDQAISGKITGALVQQNSGDPAGGISIRLRGPSTVLGNSDPLYIVDGIIISNSSAELVDLGGNTQNRLADINPNDVERIEIIKGAAAAAIYGSRASNGVVQIFTKKGKSGDPRFSFSTNVKVNELRKKIDYNTTELAWVNAGDRNNLETVPVERYDLQESFFGTGYGTENYFSVSGGTDKTTYYLSASQLDNEGIIVNSDFKRIGFKANISQKAFDWLTIKGGFNYIRSNSDDIPNGGISNPYGAITGFLFSQNSVNPNPDESGVYPVTSLLVPRTNPLEAVNRFKFGQKTNRFITSIALDANITEKLSASYTLGIDYYNQSATAFIPIKNTSPNPNGYARRSDINNFQYNSDLNLSYKTALSKVINSTTTLGGSWQYEEFDRIGITADGLPPIVETAESGSILAQGESRSQISYWGSFVQQSFSYKDKLYVNGAVRMDGASTFGKDERNQLYAKASLSYIMSEEDYWINTFGDTFNVFKIRGSWGQAGNLTALSAFQRFTVLSPGAINGSTSLIPSTQQGDLNIAPERQEEIEFGFDAGFLSNRLGLEFTYYKQRVSELLLPRELSPSTGFSSRIENIGNLENEGIEILLRGTPIKTPSFSWDVTATYSRNENVVTKVAGGGQFALGGSFSTNYVIEGEALGVFYRQYYARNPDGTLLLDANGYPQTEKGNTSTGEIGRDGNGQPVGSALSKVIGDPNPEWFGSLINEFAFKDFELRIQFDAVQGYDIFNWNRRLMDNRLFGGGYNYGQELAGNRLKNLGQAQANIFEEFVEDASFVKLRELAISYNLRSPFKNINNIEISLVGRNLVSWDSYSGWDPEINTAGQSNGVRGFDFAGVPIPKTYQLGINVSF